MKEIKHKNKLFISSCILFLIYCIIMILYLGTSFKDMKDLASDDWKRKYLIIQSYINLLISCIFVYYFSKSKIRKTERGNTVIDNKLGISIRPIPFIFMILFFIILPVTMSIFSLIHMGFNTNLKQNEDWKRKVLISLSWIEIIIPCLIPLLLILTFMLFLFFPSEKPL